MSWRRKTATDPEALRTLVAGLPEEERIVVHAAAVATKEARLRFTDRRLLILLFLVIGTATFLLKNQSDGFADFKNSQRQANVRTVENCKQTQAAFDQVNAFYDQQIDTIRNHRPDLSAQARSDLIGNYERNKLRPLDCR